MDKNWLDESCIGRYLKGLWHSFVGALVGALTVIVLVEYFGCG